MSNVEAIKKAENAPDRIWATVNGMSTRYPDGSRQLIGGWQQDGGRGGAVEYVRASTLEALQRENEQFKAEIDRTERNRDMWKGQVGRQVALLECLKDARSKLNDQSEIDLIYMDDVIARATIATSSEHGKRGIITPQMIRDTAAWEHIEDELRDELRCAADALEATETEVSRLRCMVERRDEFIIGKNLWNEFKEAGLET